MSSVLKKADKLNLSLSGDRWVIMKIDGRSFSIMEQADTVLSEIVKFCIFFW